MFSGGIGSWATAKRVSEQHGTSDLTLLFADVKGFVSCTCGHDEREHINGRGPCDVKPDGVTYCGCRRLTDSQPHIGEDEDCYRFIRDAAKNVGLGARLEIVKDGRNIWQVFKDRRFLGNSRQANCSEELKQKPCRAWLDANCDPADTIVYVGIDWTETHRIPKIETAYLPYRAEAPLTEKPYLDKDQMIAWAKSEGLEPPRMYAQGYPHANCGGGCVRAGKAQFALLHRVNPERFAVWAQKEQEVREHLGRDDVTILTEQRRGEEVNLPLPKLRERLESQPSLFDDDEFGGCGCFVA